MNYRFSPGLTLLCFVLGALCASLGSWQLSRAEQKSALQQAYDSLTQQAPIELDLKSGDLGGLLYHRVKVTGYFHPANEVLLDNQTHNTTAGYHVLTPLKTESSDIGIIVNRGWVAGTSDRKKLPHVETTEEKVTVSGRIMPMPGRSPFISSEAKPDTGGTKTWFYFDRDYFQTINGFAVADHWLQLDPNSDHGFIVNWQDYNAKEAMHIGYAIMWFSFVLIVAVIYLTQSVSRTPKSTIDR